MNKKLEVTNPGNGEVLAVLDLLSAEEVKEVVDKAYNARALWRDTPLHKRADIIFKFCEIFEKEYIPEVSDLLVKEMGKPITMAKEECEESIDVAKAGVQRALHLYSDALTQNAPGLENDLVVTKREPLGVAACIIPFNFPIELTIQKIIPALIMGNPVIVKAPSSNPMSVLKLREIFDKAGMPAEVAQFIVCARDVSTQEIIKSPKVAAVTLTGSTRAGIDVYRNSADTLKTVMLELGGNDALIIFEDADLDKAVEELFLGRIFNNGQVCCATKRVLVSNKVKDAFVEKLIASMANYKVGDATDPETVISTLVTEKAAIDVEKYINHTIEQGAKCVYGGKRIGATILPTILTDVTKDMDVAKDMEIFGPVIPVIGFDTEEEAIAIANQSSYGLSSGVMTADMQRAFRVGGQLEAGGCVLNGTGHYRHYDQAFGGFKNSGVGREGTSTSLEEFSQLKTYIIKNAFSK